MNNKEKEKTIANAADAAADAAGSVEAVAAAGTVTGLGATGITSGLTATSGAVGAGLAAGLAGIAAVTRANDGKEMSKEVEVWTKAELERAVKSGAQKIIVRGELAEKIHKAAAVKSLSKPALAAIGAAIVAMPLTGGISGAIGFAAITTTTGMSIVAITAVAFLGLALILSITNGYDRKFSAKAEGVGEASMELNKK